ncbi:hypothetical protein Bca52824_021501 [Brassica carinata]|uniref:AAA+ ATPase domain-containing protein n=1 Tax=Brassica carinata TaxID=52824 RepID=A0A8X7VEQ0_BRACI|nr:hypothetical protein Bca52824_021501 [Brassica carinata]
MMMGGAMGTFGSSMASLFFLWATFQQMFPEHLKIAIKEFLLFSDQIITFFSPYVVISFPEYEDYYRYNHAFAAIDTYLGAKAIDKAQKLKASQVKESKGLVLKRDEAKVRDEYQGVHVWWEIVTDTDGYRTQKLTFHRRGLEIVTGSYIKHVVEEGISIEAKTKKMKLFTNNPSLNWDTNNGSLWRHIDFEHPASFKTLAMDPSKKQEVLDDLEAFRNGKEYYKKIGKAWKRGYLLYGPPGTGKSTMIAAMANHLSYNIYDLELTAIKNNSELRKLLTATSSKSIIVIEDIDCSVDLTGKRKKGDDDLRVKKDGEQRKEDENQSRVTLSGLLNFIDGIWSACGQERIIVFTTNHMEKLDPALIRRGRMDMHVELSYCSFEAFKVLAKNYLDLDSHPLFGEIESLLKDTKMAPADVAEKLMSKNQIIDVDGCLKDLVQSLERRRKEQRGQDDDDHKKKPGGKKLRIFRGLF